VNGSHDVGNRARPVLDERDEAGQGEPIAAQHALDEAKRIAIHGPGMPSRRGAARGAGILARFMREDTRSTPKAAAIDVGAIGSALDMPTRRGFAQAASDWQRSALRNQGAVGLDIETSPGGEQP
jgi:hypothetical protein